MCFFKRKACSVRGGLDNFPIPFQSFAVAVNKNSVVKLNVGFIKLGYFVHSVSVVVHIFSVTKVNDFFVPIESFMKTFGDIFRKDDSLAVIITVLGVIMVKNFANYFNDYKKNCTTKVLVL